MSDHKKQTLELIRKLKGYRETYVMGYESDYFAEQLIKELEMALEEAE